MKFTDIFLSERRRLVKFTLLVKENLESKVGKKSFYPVEEITTALKELDLPKNRMRQAVAMFATEEGAKTFLRKKGIKERKRIAKKMFKFKQYVGYDRHLNCFDDPEETVSKALKGLGATKTHRRISEGANPEYTSVNVPPDMP